MGKIKTKNTITTKMNLNIPLKAPSSQAYTSQSSSRSRKSNAD